MCDKQTRWSEKSAKLKSEKRISFSVMSLKRRMKVRKKDGKGMKERLPQSWER